MELCAKAPACLQFSGTEGLLDNFRGANRKLDEVQSGLNAYLETKRSFFPRFFFLADEELLEILSETKDPHKVQPHLRKCFEAIDSLDFTENLDAIGMYSAQKERVPFIEVFNPKTAKGNVEVWLEKTEEVMRKSLKKVTHDSIVDHEGLARTDWVLNWPGQVILCVDQMHWTMTTEKYLADSGTAGLKTYSDICNGELKDIIHLVRGKLSKNNRTTIGAMVTLNIHGTGVLEDLYKQNISDAQDFDWLSQLRYTLEPEVRDEELVPLMEVRMVNANLIYGYEYLGNSFRLVVTPLTDRCYRTLMGALMLNLGGAPEGPAGTGKTETTKDLAKALSKHCVVFNCSDGLDYLAMAKFFKGVAASGAWACFDEFNRINLEVLSVVAEQISQIQQAITEGKTEFFFEGTHLRCKDSAAVFITMNPGYAGRSDLPDNLKALFRPCAMMVPNYALIGEISLYSFGFEIAKSNAEKIVLTYKLCSEQLSSQDHYDYGMRAVKSVLTAAGNLKQRFPDQDESELVLRSIIDVNLPKFLSPDIPLFEGITSDLFPGVILPKADYGGLMSGILEGYTHYNLQETEDFTINILQIYEMMIVRHGFMIVGLPFSGKTLAYDVLAHSLMRCEEGIEPAFEEWRVSKIIINPKSIKMGFLYGNFDPISHEWSDGVLAKSFRNQAQNTKTDHKWLIFDGPVDAIWIENMNTVLDDNKKLCLMSGEIIQMNEKMNLIFEPMDLKVASPATVSRCGMIYMEPEGIGWRPIAVSWLNTLPKSVTDDQKIYIQGMLDWIFPSADSYARRCCGEPVETQTMMLARSFCDIMWSLMDDFHDEEKFKKVKAADAEQAIESHCIFALVWSLGTTGNTEGYTKWSIFIRELMEGKEFSDPAAHSPLIKDLVGEPLKINMPFPDSGQVYDYVFHGKKWVEWMKTQDAFKVPAGSGYSDIIVPTVDKVRYCYVAKQLIEHLKPVLFTGPTGTGKSIYVQEMMLTGLDPNFIPLFMGMSAQTQAVQVQNIIDGKLDRRRKGVYGPPPTKFMAIFVDDLNMPQVEEYGAQPPIELLRQFLCQGGWYDVMTSEKAWRKLDDLTFIQAMGFPGGGRNEITPRFTRHMNMMAFRHSSDDAMERIFVTILDFFLMPFSSAVQKLKEPIVLGAIEVYNTISQELLPTPSKSHYTFNLRDLGKVMQGIVMIQPNGCDNAEQMTRLWVHESMRVFSDRLTDQPDRNWFSLFMKEMVEKHFKGNFEKIFSQTEKEPSKIATEGLRRLCFGGWGAGEMDQSYQEIQLFGREEEIGKIMDDFLEEYNSLSKTPMKIVLFQFAIEHLARITRILRQPCAHALLVGVGGSGRQSLTKLAVHISEMGIYSIEITKNYSMVDWRDAMKEMLIQAGGKGEPTVFLFSDTQIKDDLFLEDINNILSNGEIPNLFETGEKIEIAEMCRSAAKNQGYTDFSPNSLFAFFVQRAKANLHCVLAFSPIGDAFRERLRMFPSLVNCCTIDWFAEWPADALDAVAQFFLGDIDMPQEELDSVVKMCILFHQSVADTSAAYLAQAKRFNYVTPTAYLELIQTYLNLLGSSRQRVALQRDRYANGGTALLETESKVDIMKQELIVLQPQLVVATKETNELIVFIDKESIGANQTRVIVEAESAKAGKQAAETHEIATSCQSDLDAAIPALAKAEKALNSIKKSEIGEIKGLGNPPGNVKMTLAAVCVMMQEKPVKVPKPDGKPGEKMLDYWPTAQKMMADTGFLERLQTYDKDNIPADVIAKIRAEYITLENFQPEVVKKSSSAAEGMCVWVISMDVYERIEKVVKPKKAALAQAQAELKVVEADLAVQVAALKEVEDKIANLNAQLAEAQAKSEKLDNDAASCEAKLLRANQLLSGLGGEKVRWASEAVRLGKDYDNLTGDILISSGVVAYLGVFTLKYRTNVIQQWIQELNGIGINCDQEYKLNTCLGDPVEIRNWQISGLPKDDFSCDNGIISKLARRWPLSVDPQSQANKWIRNKEKDNNLAIIKLSDGKFVQILESAITYGTPVLLENVGEEMDPVLEPLLLKQIFKQSGVPCIKMGDSVLEYSYNFKFYITTKLSNPHYLPEVSTKVTLINFMITPEGLVDQLLSITVAAERADLEEKKVQLTLESAENAAKLKECEDSILKVLAEAEDILEDANGVKILGEAKVVSDDVNRKQNAGEKVLSDISRTRESYRSAAQIASVLFFVVDALQHVDPMYQNSLQWFIALFSKSIEDSESPEDKRDVAARIDMLTGHFKYNLYRNVCRSLFEKDKLLYSLTVSIALSHGIDDDMDMGEWRFLLTGGIGSPDVVIAKPFAWMSDKCWEEVQRLNAEYPLYKGICNIFKGQKDAMKEVFDSLTPQDMPIPGYDGEEFAPGTFHHLVLLRVVRYDKLVPAVLKYVSNKLGEKFVSPPAFDLESCHVDSDNVTPLIFVLCPGQDPMNELRSFGATVGFTSAKLKTLSLGQGQNKKAEALIEDGVTSGNWVVLQNCHLYVSWMPKLEKMVEDMKPDEVNKDFRLWLTSAPSNAFPVSILQNGVKMINEPPQGFRANIRGSYLANPISDMTFFESCSQPEPFRKLLWGLCFFHAVIQDRRKFGPIGWNIPYEFNDTDLRICVRQLNIFLSTYDFIPYKALGYLAGECNYGGRVTDVHDGITLREILKFFYCDDIMKDDHKFDDPNYGTFPVGEHADYIKYAQSLPMIQTPMIFGMDDNADITKDNKEVNGLFDAILKTQESSSGGGEGGGKSRDDIISELTKAILIKLPPNYNIEEVGLKYPTLYEESMNTVLVQEMIRYNRLTDVIRPSLQKLLKAMKGLVVMSADLDEVASCFYDGRVPPKWLGKSFPSLKPLAGYTADLFARLEFFESWYQNGPPVNFWFSGFYFPPAFLTGALQNYARRNQLAIDTVEFDFEIFNTDPTTKPPHGCYIYGMFLEGARWNAEINELDHQLPKQLLASMPTVFCKTMKTVEILDLWGPDVLLNVPGGPPGGDPFYACRVYKTSARRGVLATTGHSTNFVFYCRIPTSKPQSYWIKRGTALLCATDD